MVSALPDHLFNKMEGRIDRRMIHECGGIEPDTVHGEPDWLR